MKLNYKLRPEDFLDHQLYQASKSKYLKKRRQMSRAVVPVIYLLFGLFLLFRYNSVIGLSLFAGIGLLWFILYPIYSKHRYKNHYRKHIFKNYKNRFNKEVSIELGDGFMTAYEGESESRISMKEVNQVIELQGLFLIRLHSNQSVIVPKANLDNTEEVRQFFQNKPFKYVDEQGWKWK